MTTFSKLLKVSKDLCSSSILLNIHLKSLLRRFFLLGFKDDPTLRKIDQYQNMRQQLRTFIAPILMMETSNYFSCRFKRQKKTIQYFAKQPNKLSFYKSSRVNEPFFSIKSEVTVVKIRLQNFESFSKKQSFMDNTRNHDQLFSVIYIENW